MKIGTRIRHTVAIKDGTVVEIHPDTGAVRIEWDGTRPSKWYALHDFEPKGEYAALLEVVATKIGTRVFFTTDEDKTERSRVFMGNTIDHEFSVQAWRSSLAGLVFGDFSAYYRIRDVRVEDILSEEVEVL